MNLGLLMNASFRSKGFVKRIIRQNIKLALPQKHKSVFTPYFCISRSAVPEQESKVVRSNLTLDYLSSSLFVLIITVATHVKCVLLHTLTSMVFSPPY